MDEVTTNEVSRRSALKRLGAGAAVAWSVPTLLSLNAVASASPVPHPECVGATCATFIACSSANPDCVCVTTDDGGFCVPGSTSCAGLAPCPGGTSAECPSGSHCAVDTCCGSGVCVPDALTAQCPAGAGGAGATAPRIPGTLAGL
jgi:hypothetical protein